MIESDSFRTIAVSIVIASSLVGCGGDVVPLSFSVPASRVHAVISDDSALCGRLNVSLDFERVGGDPNPFGEDLILKEEPLVPSDDNPCTFVLDGDYGFRRGTYDLMVRFLAAPGSFPGAETCGTQGVDDLWVGAYVKSNVAFPDPPLEIDDDEFLSRPGDEGALPFSGLSFDLDRDLRDNFSEVAAGSDPCTENAPPAVSLDVDTESGKEGEPFTLTVSSEDPAALRHRLTLTLKHQNGPNQGTEVITWRRFTSTPANETLSPNVQLEELDEDWSLIASDIVEDGTGHLTATLTFTPDEPFIGTVIATLTSDDGQGTILATAPPITLSVENVLDPPTIMLDENGGLVPVERFELREVGPGVTATTRRFKLESQDGSVDASQFTVALGPGNPEGLVLDDDLSFLTVTWAPDNDAVKDAPPDGYRVVFDIRGPGGVEIFEDFVRYPIAITPLYNDAPTISTAGADTALSSGTFVAKYIRFAVNDPDEWPVAPVCTASVTAISGTPCASTTAWSEIRCEVDGVRDGSSWPFVVTLTPSNTYFTACGDDAQFSLHLSVTDAAPTGSEPAAGKTTTTAASCGSNDATCAEDLVLYTAELVSAHDVAGGPAAPTSFGAATEMIIDSKNLMGAFFADTDDDYERTAVYLVDVGSTTPTFEHRVPRDVVCEFNEGFLRVPHLVTSDDVTGRIVGFGYAAATDADCTTSKTNVVFSVSTSAPYAATSWPQTSFGNGCCANASDCRLKPVSDDGHVYLLCADDAASLLVLAPDNTVAAHGIPGIDGDGDAYGVDIVKTLDGGRYLAWPDTDGIAFIDLDSLDGGAPTVERIVVPAWNSFRLTAGTADNVRGHYLFTIDPEGDGDNHLLYRVHFDGGVPVLEAALDLGDVNTPQSHGDLYTRLLLKPDDANAPAADADLVVTGEVSANFRPHVNLEGALASLADARVVNDYYYIREVYQSPDPRYMFGHIISSTFGSPGIKLFPWDGELPFIVQDIPGTYGWSANYQRDINCSNEAGLCVVVEDDILHVLRFNQSPGLLDN